MPSKYQKTEGIQAGRLLGGFAENDYLCNGVPFVGTKDIEY